MQLQVEEQKVNKFSPVLLKEMDFEDLLDDSLIQFNTDDLRSPENVVDSSENSESQDVY